MDILSNVMITVHVIAALVIIGLVLIQHGKGADMGAAFGGGSSGSLFGATGSANFLSRATGILAAIFFLTSLGMAYVATHKPRVTSGGVMDGVAAPKPAASTAPVVPAAPGVPSPAAIPGEEPGKGAAVPEGAAPAAASSTETSKDAAKDGSKANQIPK